MSKNWFHVKEILSSLGDYLLDLHGGQTKFPDLVFATQWTNEGFKFTSFNWGNLYGSFAIIRT